jgi:polyketide cyclase/dehydrase/lipid transport protein
MGGKEGAVVKSPVPAVLAGGAAVIGVQTDIGRPAGQVFDYASDPANEPEWNIRMTRLEKLTSGPVGVGARYRMQFTQGPPALSECVQFQRPRSWEHAGESKIFTSTFGGRVAPAGNGCHLLLRMQIRPRGLLQLALPLLRRRMRSELERDIAAIKARLEGTGPGAPATPG